jgi:bleomycin hydrolase
MRNFKLFLGSFLLAIFFGNSTFAQEDVKEVGFQFDTISMVPTTPVKNQYKSGTCWSFATTSFVETEILRTTGKEYDLSEMYFVYYGYKAKAESYVRLHGTANFGPGGQAHDVMDVIRKHGMALESDYKAYIDGFDNHVHGEMDNVLSGFVKDVVKNPSGHLSNAWRKAFASLLDSYLGNPEAISDKAKELKNTTNFNPDDYVELTSYMYKPYYDAIRLEVPDNWSFARYYNIPLDEMMKLIQSSLKSGYSVCWDGDVSNHGFSHKNALAILPETNVENLQGSEQSKWEKMSKDELYKDMYSFKTPVPEKKVTEKMRQQAFDNYSATDDHLMHLTGLLKDQNGTFYYVTKNSWADNSNDNGGYLNMSDAYLRMNTLAIMVHKDALPKALRKKLGL